jgi:NHL repeat
MAYAATVDNHGNLYVADLNRNRVFIYLRPFQATTLRRFR